MACNFWKVGASLIKAIEMDNENAAQDVLETKQEVSERSEGYYNYSKGRQFKIMQK